MRIGWPELWRLLSRAARGSMETDTEGPRKLGLCVLCGLPAAGKSTFARVLGHWLRRERGWAVGVLSYDDILPDTLLDGAGAGPQVSPGERVRRGEELGGGGAWDPPSPPPSAARSAVLFIVSRRVCTRPSVL